MAIRKRSKQRDVIYSFLETRKDHPTADTVYFYVKQEFPNISLGTVYRNLQLLSEQGDIQKLKFGDGQDHFDYNEKPHAHFFCNGCGAVIDLDYEEDPGMDRNANERFAGRIDGHMNFFYGICQKCLEENK